MKRIVLIASALAALITVALSGVASAHTGSVVCDSRGVVFTYDANFEADTVVTENVGAALRLVTVHQNTATSDTWAGVTGTVTVSASWSGGGIPSTVLTCPSPPPPVVVTPPAPPPAPPAPPVTPPVTAAPPVAVTPPAVTPPKKAPKCPPHTTRIVKGHKKPPYNAKLGVLTCYKVIHVKRFIFVPTPSKGVKGRQHTGAGVTG